MKRFLLFAGLAVTVLVCGYLLGRTARNAPAVVNGPASSADTGVQGDDSRIMSAIARIEQRLELLEARPATAPVQASATPAVSDTEPPPSVQDMHQEIQDRQAGIAAEIEKRLATEPRDKFWATAAEEQLRHAAKACSGDNGDNKVTALSCRTSICKIELSVPAKAGVPSAGTLPFFVEGMAGLRRSEPVQQSDGSYTLAFDFFRKGYPMPGTESAQ